MCHLWERSIPLDQELSLGACRSNKVGTYLDALGNIGLNVIALVFLG